MHQFEQLFRQAVFRQFAQRLQRLHGIGHDHDRVIHSGLHHFMLHMACSVLTLPHRFAVTSARLRSS
jgi:hypothetical protein